MTQLRWVILLFGFLFPTVTDLLFKEVSSIWLVGCTVLALIWNLFCGFDILRLVLCLIPGILLWVLSRLSKGIGFGDVLGVFFLGMIAGFQMSLEILFGGSILCLVAQILLMIEDNVRQLQRGKEKNKFQREMPFIPWILASIWINWVLHLVM